MTTRKHSLGFTMVELLIVIGIIAALGALTFVALDPLARFQDSRNAERWADVNMIMAAVKLHQVDNEGIYLTAVNNLTNDLNYQIGAGGACNDTCSNPTVTLQTACVDLSDLVNDGYLPEVPIDPSDTGASADETRYYLTKHASGMLTVGNCSEEIGSESTIPQIQATR